MRAREISKRPASVRPGRLVGSIERRRQAQQIPRGSARNPQGYEMMQRRSRTQCGYFATTVTCHGEQQTTQPFESCYTNCQFAFLSACHRCGLTPEEDLMKFNGRGTPGRCSNARMSTSSRQRQCLFGKSFRIKQTAYHVTPSPSFHHVALPFQTLPLRRTRAHPHPLALYLTLRQIPH